MSEAVESLNPSQALDRYRIDKWTSESRSSNEEVHGLTGLPYETLEIRRHLRREVESAGQSGQNVTTGFIDMDALGVINVRFGHDAGNECIRAWANEVRGQALEFAKGHPESQVFLFHLYEHRGDELRFLIIGGQQEDELVAAINETKATLEVNGQTIEIFGSCGSASNKGESGKMDLTSLEVEADLETVKIKEEKIKTMLASLERIVTEEDFASAVEQLFGWRKLSPETLRRLLTLHRNCVGKQFIKPGTLAGKN